MINNEIRMPIIESIDSIGTQNTISIEVVNDDITNEEFDEFIQYVVEEESREREYPFVGNFESDFLILNLSEELFHFSQRSERDFDEHVNDFIEWYKTKVSEYFNIELSEIILDIDSV